MLVKLLKNTKDIRNAFIDRFTISWEEFQISHKDWIEERAKTAFPIDLEWYKQSYMWDRAISDFSDSPMDEALAFLRGHSGPVIFMADEGKEGTYYQGKKLVDFVAEADAQILAAKIEQDWYETYRLAEQNIYYDAFLPEDLYVFDASMQWCLVFTHETTDWKEEDLMKEAETRLCMICKA